jgi:YD repeat-containing protein
MRHIKLFPWLLAVLIFASACATQPPEPAGTGEQEKAVEKTEQEKRTVTEEVQLVKRRLSYFPKGVLDRYRVYVYPEEGTRLLQEKLYDSEDTLQQRVEYRYNDRDLRTEKAVYDAEGELQRKHEYSYDADGNLTEDTLYDGNGEMQSRSEYRYDDSGRKVQWRVYDSNDNLMAYTKYIYRNGRRARIENYRPGGAMEDYFVIKHDQQGRKTRSTWYDSDDEVVQYRTFDYEEGALSEEVVHRSNDTVKLRIVYTNNEQGNPVRVRYEQADGDMQEQISYEYITRTQTKIVAER